MARPITEYPVGEANRPRSKSQTWRSITLNPESKVDLTPGETVVVVPLDHYRLKEDTRVALTAHIKELKAEIAALRRQPTPPARLTLLPGWLQVGTHVLLDGRPVRVAEISSARLVATLRGPEGLDIQVTGHEGHRLAPVYPVVTPPPPPADGSLTSAAWDQRRWVRSEPKKLLPDEMLPLAEAADRDESFRLHY